MHVFYTCMCNCVITVYYFVHFVKKKVKNHNAFLILHFLEIKVTPKPQTRTFIKSLFFLVQSKCHILIKKNKQRKMF